MSDADTNSGVVAQSGFALQRNTAIYILLNNYHLKFQDRNYFICLEHHDDFVPEQGEHSGQYFMGNVGSCRRGRWRGRRGDARD